ncbi:tetratricopeptide repeat protein [Brachyspira innocens]|uniref:tetratricopeptide repeat protein n=1 Tax=Brachyspira innocens TaxID=13264 RepID=UPI0026F18743|nr:tetratricopeptide repeat protein [Brachyspira innocens]
MKNFINIVNNQNNNNGNIYNYTEINNKPIWLININININIDDLIKTLPNIVKKAYKSFKCIIKKHDTLDEIINLNNNGVLKLLEGSFEEAIKCFDEAIKKDKTISEIHYNLGNAKFGYYNENLHDKNIDNIFEEILDCYNEAIKYDREDYRYYYNRGTIYAFMKKYTVAISDLSYSIKLDNSHSEPYINRANIYIMEKNLDLAEKDLKIAKELSKDTDKYLLLVLYNNLGNLYFQKLNLDEAEHYYKDALNIKSDYLYSILGLANIYMYYYEYSKDTSNYEQSLFYFNEAEKLKENLDGIYFNKSKLFYIKANIENDKNLYIESLNILQKGLSLLDKNNNIQRALYYYSEGIIFGKLFFYDRDKYKNCVISSYEKSIKLNDKDFNPYYNLANFYDTIGEKRKSIDYYTKSIKINNLHESSYNNRAAVYIELKMYDEALDDLNEIIKINSDNFGAYYNIGVIYSMQNKLILAIDMFKNCLSNRNSDSVIKMNAYYNLGILIGRMGNNEEAIKNIIKSYELGNDNAKQIIEDEAIKYKNQVAIDYLEQIK